MKKLVCALIVYLPLFSWADDRRIDIARFSQGEMSDWQTKSFTGETRYVLEDQDGRLALRADSVAAASGRYHEITIDLNETPILNWTWKVENILTDIDEHTRAGDDYAARIYVVFSGGLAFWRTRAINYVWSSNQPVGGNWSSAFTGNVRMIAMESGTERLGQWISERRNVHADYQYLFGEQPGNIDAIAIMTDTDNSGGKATAWYGDICYREITNGVLSFVFLAEAAMDPRTIAENVNSIFSLPDVALRINELINSGEATNTELEQIILHDPALTAKILRFANSAYFGLSRKIETVSHAISLMGYKELHNLVIAISVTSTFDGISSNLVDMTSFWYHSLTCGVVARLFAINLNSGEQERFFIAGLLHGIGRLVLLSQYPEEAVRTLHFKDQGDDAIIDAEYDIFGFTSIELGIELLQEWRLPASIWKIIEFQRNPLSNEKFKEAACILHMASGIANCIQPCVNRKINFYEIQSTCKPEVWSYLGLNPDIIELVIDETGMQVFEILAVIKPEAIMKF